MQIDKIIYQELKQRRTNKDFQKTLKKLGLVSTYKQELAFFESQGHLKIPFMSAGNLFEDHNNINIIKKENKIIIANIMLAIFGLACIGNALFYISTIPLIYSSIAIASGITVLGISMFLVHRSLRHQDLYIDLMHSNIVTILDFADCWEQTKLDDIILLRLLSDLKATKTAYILATQSGFMLSNNDLENTIDEKILTAKEISQWDDESTHTSKSKAA
jgi:hypothetical protein